VAYICRGSTCSAPLDSLEVLTEQLREEGAQPQPLPPDRQDSFRE